MFIQLRWFPFSLFEWCISSVFCGLSFKNVPVIAIFLWSRFIRRRFVLLFFLNLQYKHFVIMCFIVYRCIPAEYRTFSMGLKWMFIRFLGKINVQIFLCFSLELCILYTGNLKLVQDLFCNIIVFLLKSQSEMMVRTG